MRALLVTDLAYPAAGRRYGDEDVWLAGRLRGRMAVAMAHPADAAALADVADVVVIRNSGPVLHHRDAHAALVAAVARNGIPTYNSLDGHGDQAGKRYLVDLTAAGFPVIPTIDRLGDLHHLPDAGQYVVKPVLGADSIGLRRVDRSDLADVVVDGEDLVQPLVDFRYEVSFVVVDGWLAYAVHAPDPDRRWELVPYEPTAEDRAFVDRFVGWNALSHGVQRVDACRTRDGGLLLVELEDLNPYLSLDRLDPAVRDRAADAIVAGVAAVART